MVLNDFRTDFKSLLKLDGKMIKDLSAETGIKQNTISTAISGQIINKSFVNLVDAAGYDIKVTYIKKPISFD